MSELKAKLAKLSPEQLAALAKRVRREAPKAEGQPAIPRRGGEGPWRLSFAQERLWFLARLEPDSSAYSCPNAFHIRGRFQIPLLERTLEAVAQRHESLRTVFREVDGRPRQEVLPSAPPSLRVVDLSPLPAEAREAEIEGLEAEEVDRPFDLSRGPLLRVLVARLSEEHHLVWCNLHHIVTDGWSNELLVQEIGSLYGAFSEGLPSPLPAPEIQYPDFAEWQRRRYSDEVLEGELAFWRQRLTGAPQELALPFDGEGGAPGTGHEVVRIPRRVSDGLQALAREEGATLFMAALAAFEILLARYSQQEDFLVGTPVSGRDRIETERLLGFFVNTLVLRADLSGRPGLRRCLRRVRQGVTEAYSHQVLPFERVVEALQEDRSSGSSGMVQVVFTVKAAPSAELSLAGLTLEPRPVAGDTAKFPLTVSLSEEAGGLVGELEFAKESFSRPTVRAMARHFVALLAAATAAPDRSWRQLDLLSPAERRQLEVEWAGGTTAYPRNRHLATLWEERVAAAPDAVAVLCGGRQLTYAALDRRANGLAHRLLASGVGRGDRIGLAMERGMEMAIATLAILKAGGAYLPLDPAYPPERLRLMMEDAEVGLILAEPARAEAFREVEGARVEIVPGPGEERDEPPALARHAQEIAYSMFTSGSTGRPKGIEIPHRAVARLVLGTDYLDLGPDDRVAQVANTSFDAATFEIWGAFLNGGTLVVFPRELTLGPRALAEAFRETRITALFLTTALFNLMAAEIPDAFRRMRYVLFGGEQVDPSSVRRVLAAGPPEHLLHVYGPTENTTFSTWHEVREVADGAWTIPIGRAIANSYHRVLDRRLRPVPAAVDGELCLGGDGLATGYLNRPALTAERFVPDPAGGPGQRLYRTGDRVRLGRDGAVEFQGRFDDQVKIRGFRIEPGEVGVCLAEHPDVEAAFALVRRGEDGQARLTAYAVLPGDGARTGEALRGWLEGRLPAHMVPSVVAVLDELPLNANGKVDRRALPEPSSPEGSGAVRHVAPRTGTEALVAGIWCEVLGVERAGALDDFFDLGGHSLVATRVISRLREALGVEIPLRTVFDAPTVEALAREADRYRGAGAGVEAPPLEPVLRDGPLPLSFAQQRLWFIEQFEPGGHAYNMPMPLRARGPLNLGFLQRGLSAVLERHEVLRSRFLDRGGQPLQEVLPPAQLPLPVVDLSALAAADREGEMHRWISREAAHPFDLAVGPMLRARVLRLAAEDHVILFSMHHIASDGWSMGVLVDEISELYGAFREGREAWLPALPIQYVDFAAWQRSWLDEAALEGEVDYWRRRLGGAPAVLELPTDRPRPAQPRRRAEALEAVFPAELATGLEGLSRSHGATLFMTLISALQTLFWRISGQDDVCVGTPVAGRTVLGLEPLIGFFVNTLVVRTGFPGGDSFATLLGRVRGDVLEAQAHQHLPFERLVEELKPDRDLSNPPFFRAVFALQNGAQRDLVLPQLRIEAVEDARRVAKFDLNITLAQEGDTLRAGFEYDTDLFDRVTVERFLGWYRRILEQATASPQEPLSRLSLCSAAEGRQLEGWAGRRSAYPRDGHLASVWEEQVALRPEAVALVAGGRRLTYGALDRWANALAHRLVSRGIRRGDRVGLALGRCPEMVAATLAALKAGATYLPLDPEYPPQRLGFMARDGEVRCLLSTAASAPSREAFGNLPVEVLDEARDGRCAAPPSLSRDARELAYVMYTSGSTGRPKGVGIPHRAVLRLVLEADFMDLGPEEVFLQLAPISFDAATLEIWGPLLNGGRLVLAPAGAQSLEGIGGLLQEHGVTSLWLTAGLFHLLADERPEVFAGLRQLLAGGDALSPPRVRRVLGLEAGPTVINGYGPTESTTFATCHGMAPGTAFEGSVPIGRPIADTSVWVVDRRLELQPPGVAGELVVGGDGLAQAYVGRPGITAERFVPNPFGTAGSRVYRTGDRVRWTAVGELRFEGRFDDQVKIRGFRVEPGEVSACLAEHPAVESAYARVDRREGEEARLLAYAVPAAAVPEETPRSLRLWLRERLPAHLVPWAVVLLDELPLNANGKVDRRALPVPDPEGELSTGEHLPPRTPTERLIAGIWEGVLGVGGIGARDDFFALGGHSLLATQVVSRLRSNLSVEVSLRALFEHPTVEGLARLVGAAGGGGEAADLPPIEILDRGRPLPLSFAQQRLWFIDQLEPGSPAYNMPVPLRARGPFDLPALERALSTVLERHEVLRSRYLDDGGRPLQEVLAPSPLAVPVVDLSSLSQEAAGREEERWVGREAALPFDLRRGPMLRVRLLRRGAEEHVLLFTMHHIASDGWSLGILIWEVSHLYRAYAAGESPALAPLGVQYADFAAWQRGWLRGEALEGEIAHWRRRLEGAPEVLELPTDRPRPDRPRRLSDSVPLELPRELSAAVGRCARRRDATVFMTLLACLQALLSRLCGQGDVAVGTAVAGRTAEEVEELIGFFVNTLVVRTRLRREDTFSRLLGRVREEVLEAQAHQHLPFERLVEELQPDRDLANPPLFRVMFALQNVRQRDLHLGDLQVEALERPPGVAKFDLNFILSEEGTGISGGVEFDTDLFDPSTVERFVGAYRWLLEQALAEPERPLRQLALVTPAQRHQLEVELAGSPTPYPREGHLVDLWEEQVARSPQAIAVTSGDRQLTYRELDGWANGIARRLLAQGVLPGERVGMAVGRDLRTVAVVLGILKAGGAYFPLDPEYPQERLRFMAEDGGLRRVLVGPQQAPALGHLPGVHLEAVEDPPRRWDAPPPRRPRHAEEVAYVMFTSGSTGRPKGIAISHRAIARLVLETDYVRLGPGDRMAQIATISFDASTFEIWGPLLTGGTLVILPRETTLDPARLARALEEERISAMFLTTALFNLVAREAPEAFRHARYVLFGGEQVDPASARRVLRGRPPEHLLHVYGPTENTTFSTWHRVLEVEAGATAVPIGRAIANSYHRVLDPRLHPLPLGVPGELCLGGDGLAQGYHNRPALTAERFVPDPAGGAGERLYRTGDRVRLGADGTVEFLGRFDDQVKIRGFRIEPGEVAAYLGEHPAVETAHAVVREDGSGEPRLIAYAVLSRQRDEAPEDLEGWLAARLPTHLVPWAVVPLETLPLTPNGKVDRKALPDPAAGSGRTGPRMAPRTETETKVSEIWQEVLGLDEVGLEDGFFTLGGHSLLATQVMARVRGAFGAEIPLRDLFEAGSLADFAGRIDARCRGQGVPAGLPPVAAVDRTGLLPVSFSQERLWLFDRMFPASPAYNIPFALRLQGRLEVAALEASFGEILRRHEVLRTRFVDLDGEPRQVVDPPRPMELPVVDLRGLDDALRSAAARGLVRREADRGFDLEEAPLLRAWLLRLGREEWALLATVHHIAGDGGSVAVLQRELGELYSFFVENPAFGGGAPPVLAPLPVQYGDYAVWQRRHLAGERLRPHVEFWKGQLEGAPRNLDLPGMGPRPERPSHRGGHLEFQLPAAAEEAFRRRSRELEASGFVAALTAFGLLLRHLTGQEDMLVGTPVAQRSRQELEPLIGYFVNTLVIRLEPAGDPSFGELVGRVRRRVERVLEHRELPLEALLEELEIEASADRHPLFQVMFSYHTAHGGGGGLRGLRMTSMEEPLSTSTFDLTFALTDSPEGLLGAVEYSKDLFDHHRVVAWAELFQRLLTLLGEEPEIRWKDLSRRLAAIRRERDKQREEELASASLGKLRRRRRRSPRESVL